MRIPQNIITENQYTAGKEFMYVATYKEYIGYYYIANDRYFTGKTYNSNSSSFELIKIEKENTNLLLTQASTYIYGLLSKNSTKNLSLPKFNSVPKSNLDIDQEGVETYYAKQLNVTPILIKQINKDTFNSLQSNSFYEVVSINPSYSNLDEAEKKMPGIKAFLRG
jgi:hypothetical protein